MPYEFREPKTEADLAFALGMRNAFVPHHPITLDQFRQRMTRDRSDRWIIRQIGSLKGTDRTYGFVHEPDNLDAGIYFWMVCANDLEDFAATFRHLFALAEARGAKGGRSWIPSYRNGEIDWLRANGFVEAQRNPVSACDLTTREFDGESATRRLAEIDVEVIDLAEFAQREPVDFRRRIWRLEMDIFADVPSPEPFVEVPFEEFENQFDDPHMRPDAIHFAFRSGFLLGMTSLNPNVVDSALADTALTGTTREARGLGIATGLKTISLAWAKSQGINKVYTDNEEANPMRRINARLGFTHEFDWLIMQRG